MYPWPFPDAANTAVITLASIIEGREEICHVAHDADDGAWQFLSLGDPIESEARIVGLGEILRIDPTVADLADLPIGWRAWRPNATRPWQKAPKSEQEK